MNTHAASSRPASSPPRKNGPPDAGAALKGASLAFNKTSLLPPKPAPSPRPIKKDGAALLAATSASNEQSRSRSPVDSAGRAKGASGLGRSASVGSAAGDSRRGYSQAVEHDAVSRRLSQVLAASGTSGSANLRPPGRQTNLDPKSPSFIAATLAASRSESPTPRDPSPARGGGRQTPSVVGERRSSDGGYAAAPSQGPPDATPIGPAMSLISALEGRTEGDPVKRAGPYTGHESRPSTQDRSLTPPMALSRKPPEASDPKTDLPTEPAPRLKGPQQSSSRPMPKPSVPVTARQVGPRPVTRPASPPRVTDRHSAAGVTPTSSPLAQGPKLRPPTPPKRRGTAGNPPSLQSKNSISPQDGSVLAANASSRPKTSESVSSDDTFVSASSKQSPPRTRERPKSILRKPSSPRSLPTSPTRQHMPSNILERPNPRTIMTPALPLTSLSNAIVASSLASARLTPNNTGNSILSPPPLPARQKSPRLLQTLRQPQARSEDEADRRRKKPRAKLGPSSKHFHHEGARRRWREEITARECKRYEAVWASNRGIFLDNSGDPAYRPGVAEHVVNLVVRDIWKRSRLPMDELAEVWDLVDTTGQGALGKQEFVVGMWLIDQRLRGRKIPAKVSQSVWDSAKGLKVLGPKAKK